MSRIKTILKKLPVDFISKEINKTSGVEALLKIYQLGYTGTICKLSSLELRSRGVSSFDDVLTILLMKDPKSTILQLLQHRVYENKYSIKNVSDYG